MIRNSSTYSAWLRLVEARRDDLDGQRREDEQDDRHDAHRAERQGQDGLAEAIARPSLSAVALEVR